LLPLLLLLLLSCCRPLLMYLCFEGLYFAQRLIMAGYGFQHRTRG
jgi:hypothetical protein